jgi:hypothetical protein
MRVILMLVMVLLSNEVMASWSQITLNNEAIIYADLSTIQKTGNLVKMWDISDFKKKSVPDKFLSIKSLHEFDCKLSQSRVINFAMYSGNMASGKVVQISNAVHAWLPVKTGGVSVALWTTACKKR